MDRKWHLSKSIFRFETVERWYETTKDQIMAEAISVHSMSNTASQTLCGYEPKLLISTDLISCTYTISADTSTNLWSNSVACIIFARKLIPLPGVAGTTPLLIIKSAYASLLEFLKFKPDEFASTFSRL